jgi:uncharacterized protein YjiS (DUF1127 family)
MTRAESIPALPLTALPPLSRGLVNLGLMLARWDTRLRSRRALARLDAHLLHDIGLSATTAEDETARPFWR